MTVEIRRVELTDVLSLRQELLRPTQHIDELTFDGDEDAGAAHLGAFDGDRLVGIGSIVPSTDSLGRWRIRQVGVVPDRRGEGIGADLVAALLAVADGDIHLSARAHLEDWYLAMGFERVGDVYDKPPVGPHVDMVLSPGQR